MSSFLDAFTPNYTHIRRPVSAVQVSTGVQSHEFCFALTLEPKKDMSTPPPRPGSVLQRQGFGLSFFYSKTITSFIGSITVLCALSVHTASIRHPAHFPSHCHHLGVPLPLRPRVWYLATAPSSKQLSPCGPARPRTHPCSLCACPCRPPRSGATGSRTRGPGRPPPCDTWQSSTAVGASGRAAVTAWHRLARRSVRNRHQDCLLSL